MKRLLLLGTAFVLPWALAIGSHSALELWFPGRIETQHWRHFASGGFIVGGVGAVIALRYLRRPRHVRVVLSVLAMTGAIWFAFMFQLRSRCGDESQYVGHVQGVELASCAE